MQHEAVQKFTLSLKTIKTDGTRQWAENWTPGSVLKQVFSLRSDSVLGESLPILIILMAYIIAVYALSSIYGFQDRIVLKYYYAYFFKLSALFSALFIGFNIPKERYRLYLTPRYVGGFFVIVIAAPLFKTAFSSFKQVFPYIHNFSFDRDLMRLDYLIHFGQHPWKLLEFLLSHPFMVVILDRLYMLWFLILFLACFLMAWTKKRRLRLCFFVSTLLVWIVLGSGMGTAFSSAGPCYYSSATGDHDDPFSPLMARLDEIHKDTFLYAVNNQRGLWEAKVLDYWLPFGGISAMPSIHLAMATIFVLLAFNYHKWLGIASVLYLCIIQVGSVILAWHYAIDGYAGIILTFVIWFGVKRVLYRHT